MEENLRLDETWAILLLQNVLAAGLFERRHQLVVPKCQLSCSFVFTTEIGGPEARLILLLPQDQASDSPNPLGCVRVLSLLRLAQSAPETQPPPSLLCNLAYSDSQIEVMTYHFFLHCIVVRLPPISLTTLSQGASRACASLPSSRLCRTMISLSRCSSSLVQRPRSRSALWRSSSRQRVRQSSSVRPTAAAILVHWPGLAKQALGCQLACMGSWNVSELTVDSEVSEKRRGGRTAPKPCLRPAAMAPASREGQRRA